MYVKHKQNTWVDVLSYIAPLESDIKGRWSWQVAFLKKLRVDIQDSFLETQGSKILSKCHKTEHPHLTMLSYSDKSPWGEQRRCPAGLTVVVEQTPGIWARERTGETGLHVTQPHVAHRPEIPRQRVSALWEGRRPLDCESWHMSSQSLSFFATVIKKASQSG